MNLGVYAVLGDEALAELASKGLVRRAQKDLERAPLVVRERTAERVVLAVPDEGYTVTMPLGGPGQATCPCAAEGACRHILAGTLFLRDLGVREQAAATAGSRPAAPDPAEQLVAYSEADLAAWAGRPVYRQALDDLHSGALEVVAREKEGSVIFQLPQLNVTVHYLAGAGLEGMICSCKRERACRHRVAAVLAFGAAHGKPLPPAPQRSLQAALGTPRSRAEVLSSVQETIESAIVLGLSRLSQTTEGRLLTLAVSAHGVDLPYLERVLRALASHVAWQVGRDVRADTAAALHAAARAYALACALRDGPQPPPHGLVGEHRSRYFDVGSLELAGLGAQQWQTRSGYAGLSVLFWDLEMRRWASWTYSRPTFRADAGPDPARHYAQGSMWEGAPAPVALSRGGVRLTGARRNRAGRLSGHAGCQAFATGPTDPARLGLEGLAFDDWGVLAARIAEVRSSGLVEGTALESLVVAVPAGWDEPTYDERRQALVRPVRDAAGRRLPLVMPHAPGWPFAVDTLQGWRPERWETWGVLGYGRIMDVGLALTPVSLFNRMLLPAPLNSSILHLTLDSWQSPPPSPAAEPAVGAEEGGGWRGDGDEEPDDPDDDALLEADEASVGGASSALDRLLGAAALALEHLAERGVRGSPIALEERMEDLSDRVGGLGLGGPAAALAALARRQAGDRHTAEPDHAETARALLRAYYVIRLAAEGMATTRTLAALVPGTP